jgi:hypothetical protein
MKNFCDKHKPKQFMTTMPVDLAEDT